MGMEMSLRDQAFSIKQELFEPMLKDLRAYGKTGEADVNKILKNPLLQPRARIQEAISFLFDQIGCMGPQYSEQGDIVSLEFQGEKRGWGEDELFSILALYVGEGCYLEFSQEDGERFRFVFGNQEVAIVYPRLVWPAFTSGVFVPIPPPKQIVKLRKQQGKKGQTGQ